MIIGLGIDLVDNERIRRSLERFGERFMEKLLHESEQASLPSPANPSAANNILYVSSRFAAKEAGVKALGSGFSGGIGLHDVRVRSLPSGKPELTFHGRALELAQSLGVARIHLSLTHTPTSAAAVAVLEGMPGRERP